MRRRLALPIALALAACGAPSDAPPPPDAAIADAPSAVADAPADAGRPPPYPIVLAHGFFGFEDFAGAGFVDYFWRVRTELAARGETEVFTPAVDPFAGSSARGAQLLVAIEGILAETGASRVNLIGHSQGGLDARVVAHDRPDLVASVTTIATPHGGSPIADIVIGAVADDRAQDLADALVRAIAAPLYDAAGNETSVFDSLRQFSTEGIAALDRDYPDAPDVLYFSIAGRSDWHPGGADCVAPDAPDFVARLSAEIDPIDPLLSLSEEIVEAGPGTYPNDGLVRARDAVHGVFLGCVPADHFDEIGQLLGDAPGGTNDFDHVELYAELIAWLRAQGL